jgi:hypothetical protein
VNVAPGKPGLWVYRISDTTAEKLSLQKDDLTEAKPLESIMLTICRNLQGPQLSGPQEDHEHTTAESLESAGR